MNQLCLDLCQNLAMQYSSTLSPRVEHHLNKLVEKQSRLLQINTVKDYSNSANHLRLDQTRKLELDGSPLMYVAILSFDFCIRFSRILNLFRVTTPLLIPSFMVLNLITNYMSLFHIYITLKLIYPILTHEFQWLVTSLLMSQLT